ncbi:MAG: exodeoxyribonuclease III [Nannocystaceae bacterium]
MATKTKPFTLMSWNVNGVRARLDHVLTYLAEKEPDVVCLQETKVEDKLFPRVPFMEMGYSVSIHGSKGYAGVATLSKSQPSEVVPGFRDGPADKACRILNTVVDGVRIYNLYVPNGTKLGSDAFTYKLEWFKRLRAELDAHSAADEPIILIGDMNIAPEERDVFSLDKMKGQIHFTDDEHAALGELLAFGLQDCFRKHNAAPGQYTWYDYRGGAFRKKEGLRIDHVYATPPVYARCSQVIHDLEPRTWESTSDHLPVIATFD